MDSYLIAPILFASVVAATPLIIAGLGELITQKAGVLNLGIEGMMSVGAVVGFAIAHDYESTWLGVIAAMFAGMACSLVFGFVVLTLQANQVASGLAMAISGVGLSAFIGKSYESMGLLAVPTVRLPLIADIPVVGEALYQQQSLVYFSWILFWVLLWFLYKTRAGLIVRAVGESPSSAHAIGYKVIGIRYLAVMFGGAMAGIAGSFLSVFYTPLWVEGMVAGRGWIAGALVVFATWRPFRLMVGAYLFGGVMIIQLFIQGSGMQINVPSQWFSSLPYLATIIVLVIISRNHQSIRLNSPMSLGQPFRADA